MRPSLEGLDVVCENCRRAWWFAEVVWKAGTRKLGRVIANDGELMAAVRTRPLLGASIMTIQRGTLVVVQLQRKRLNWKFEVELLSRAASLEAWARPKIVR